MKSKAFQDELLKTLELLNKEQQDRVMTYANELLKKIHGQQSAGLASICRNF
jgi:hypothetical protein